MPPLDCPFCDHQNPAGAKFCNDCGSPLHLTPCGDCGAVNNVTDTHCWRCSGLLMPLHSPVRPASFEREPGVPGPQPTEHELEQELVALEQEVQDFEPAPRTTEGGARVLAQEPRGSRLSDAPPFFDEVDTEPRRPRHGVMATASVAVLASAIAVGAYLYDRDRASPGSAAPTSPPSEPLRAAASTAPGVARDVGEAPPAIPTPPAGPEPKGVDAPIERHVASDAGEAPAVPAPAAAPDPSCPPAVAAMALCEWLARANGK
jgi:hypothetical protein